MKTPSKSNLASARPDDDYESQYGLVVGKRVRFVVIAT